MNEALRSKSVSISLFLALATLTCMLLLADHRLAHSDTAAAGTPIKIGMSAPFSGPNQSLGIELYRGSRLYFDHINSQGGVFGRPVQIVPLNDEYTPGPCMENTITFGDQPDLTSLFNFVGTPTTVRILPLLKAYKSYDLLLFFPFTGAETLRTPPYDKYIYNLRASYKQEVDALINGLVQLGKTKFAIFFQIDAYGRSGWSSSRNALARHGLKLCSEVTYRRGSSYNDSFKEQAGIIAASSPDAVISIASTQAAAGFIRDLRNTGITAPVANISFVNAKLMLTLLTDQEYKDGKVFTSSLVNSQVVPFYGNQDIPAAMQYELLMATTPPPLPENVGVPPDYIPENSGSIGFEGFLNAKLITEIFKNAGPLISRKTLNACMDSLPPLEIGINKPIILNSSQHQALNQIYFITFSGSQVVPLKSLKRLIR